MTELNPKRKPAAVMLLEMAREFEHVLTAADRQAEEPDNWLQARARAITILAEANALLNKGRAGKKPLSSREHLTARIQKLTERANACMTRMAQANYEGHSRLVCISYEQWNNIVRQRQAAERKLQKLSGGF